MSPKLVLMLAEANITSFFADPFEKKIYVTDSNENIYCFEVP
jgi:hypothetical protein